MNAQSINYYKLNKIEDYGKVQSKCTGGQFIKINKYVCFDSDIHGNSVGNGKLYRDITNSTTNYIYKGQSFHGNVKYIFSYDYKSLIVEITPKFRYFYNKTTPPAEVKTCSLIKSSRSSSSESEISPYTPPNTPNEYNNEFNKDGSKHNSASNSHSNSNSNASTPARKFKCAYCNGTGRIEKNDNAPASFGTDRPKQRCNECGKWYDPNIFTHYHQTCRLCGGTGYAK